MNTEHLEQLKEISESFQSGKANVDTIRQLSKIIEKMQSDKHVEVNYNQAKVGDISPIN